MKFARKLNKSLVKMAKEKNAEVSIVENIKKRGR